MKYTYQNGKYILKRNWSIDFLPSFLPLCIADGVSHCLVITKENNLHGLLLNGGVSFNVMWRHTKKISDLLLNNTGAIVRIWKTSFFCVKLFWTMLIVYLDINIISKGELWHKLSLLYRRNTLIYSFTPSDINFQTILMAKGNFPNFLSKKIYSLRPFLSLLCFRNVQK